MPNTQPMLRVLRLFVMLLGIAGATAAAFAGPNLLRNPGFEEGIPGHAWMPTFWDTSRTGLPSVFFGRDTLSPHSGQFSVNVANVSTRVPMAYNWSQAVIVSPDAWNKDAVFTIWTRSNGLEGRAYILLQAYRDTVSKMAMTWGVERDEGLRRLHITQIDDPLVDLGWNRLQFTDTETGWVKREVRVFVPPSVNMLFVRGGVLGTGQVMFDDASLTLETALPAPELPLHTNLLKDPGFEGDGTDWELSLPPYPDTQVEKDETVKHGGNASVRIEGHTGMVDGRAGVCQVICNHNIAGKRVRISAWVKTDSLHNAAFLKVYAHGMGEPYSYPGWEQFSGTHPWTRTQFEVDIPNDAYVMWVWFLDTIPAEGRAWFDDMSAEVLGPATGVIGPGPNAPATPPVNLPPAGRPAARKSGSKAKT